MSVWSDIGDAITGSAVNAYNSVVNAVTEPTYQSPLESMGIAMRQAMKPCRYYGKQYPYATAVQTDFIRTNSSYVSASGWRPSTYGLNLDIHDKEYSNIASQFDEQTGGGINGNYRTTNTGNTKDSTVTVESYGSSNNYVANTKNRVSISKLGTQED